MYKLRLLLVGWLAAISPVLITVPGTIAVGVETPEIQAQPARGICDILPKWPGCI